MIAVKQRTAAKRPGIERWTVEIKQTRYFKNALTLKMSKMYLSNGNQNALEKWLCFCFHRKQEAVELFQVDMDLMRSRDTS